MGISFIALNRVAEDRAAADPAYRRELERSGKTLLSQARLLTDVELLAKLRSFGIELDKPSYLEQCRFALSAEEMSHGAVTSEVRARFRGRFDEDWIWFALTVLWERWFPELANYEQLDDRMQLGYSQVKADSVMACENWFLAWTDFLSLCDRGDFKSVEAFDADFRGTQFVSNWVQDFETELMKAAMQDARWQRRRIEFCEQYLQQFSLPNDLTTENMRRSLAEAMFEAGDSGKGDALFEQWLKDDPQWGWGWIGWSDCYFQFAAGQNRELRRAEQVLKRGLDVSDVRDRNDIQDRLADLYEEQGRHAESQAIRETLASATSTVEVVGDDQLSIRTKLNFEEEELPLDQLPKFAAQLPRQQESIPALPRQKPGRNDPCPCGSGRKYKKCCLAKDDEQARRAAAAKAAAQLAKTETLRRLEVPAPPPPAPVTLLPDPDANFRDDEAGADSLPPELHRKFDELWDGFLAVKQPTAGQMDAFLDGLLAFPPDATSWCDLLHRFARAGHPDLPVVFRRISNRVAHTKEAGLCYFYWGAAEESVRCGHRELLPEVAAGFRKLDSESYDADALKHLEDWLLAEGLETETLALGEHFLPILRADEGLMPYAAPELANLIFELRAGRHLRAGADPGASVERVAEELRRDLDEDVSPEAARSAAGVITGQSPPPAWSRSEFALVSGDISTDADAWQQCLRLFRTLMHVAREAWQVEQYPPACALRGLNLMLSSVYRAQDDARKKRKKAPQDLLDHLLPAGMERRLVRAAGDLIGVNEPHARLLLDSHGILLRFAERHQLMSEADVARSRQNLERLRRDLDRH